MKIRLLAPIPGHSAGEVVEVVPNWQRLAESPKWLTADNYPVGVFSHEAEVLQKSGHPISAIVGDDEGTSYCIECAEAVTKEKTS